MGRPKQHDDTTREALLAAAENLVERGGTGALSVRAVADEIGTTTRAVYSTFGSKEGLLAALAKRSFDMLRDAIAELPTRRTPRVIWSRPRSRCSGRWPSNTHRSSRSRSSARRPTRARTRCGRRRTRRLRAPRRTRPAARRRRSPRRTRRTSGDARIQRHVLRNGSDRVTEPSATRTRSPTSLVRRVSDAHQRVPRTRLTSPVASAANVRLGMKTPPGPRM